jgi:flagellar protein FliS
MAVATSYQHAARYRQSQVETATPAQLLVMLYDGAIRFLTIAREKMATGEIEPRHTNLLKTQNILAELLSSLNLREGGEVAINLQRVYTYMLQQLVEANLQDNPKPIEEVLGMFCDLRDSWAVVAQETLSQGRGHANAAN